MRTILTALPLFAAMLLAACAHLEPSFQGDRMRDTWGNASDRRHVRVRGIGTAPKSVTGTVRRRAASRQAALVEARKELLSIVGGTRMTGGITVRDALVIDSELRESVDRLVFGAEEVLAEWDSEDSCVVTLQVSRAEVEKIIEGVKPTDLPPPLPEPMRKFWKSESIKEDRQLPSPAREYDEPYDGYSPNKALAYGLLFPGGGQIYASGKLDNDVNGYSPTMFKGILYMMTTMTLVGVGASELEKPKGPAAEKDAQVHRTTGYACLGLGVVTWVYGAVSAKDALERPLSVYAGPDGGGARYSWRF